MTTRSINLRSHEITDRLGLVVRVLKPRKHASLIGGNWSDSYVLDPENAGWLAQEVPYAPGDILIGKETWQEIAGKAHYKATAPFPHMIKWRSPAIMPRRLARFQWTVTEVDVMRLQDVTEEMAIASGVTCWVCGGRVDGLSENDCACFHTKTAAVPSFECTWNATNPNHPWESNPWIVAAKIERTEQ